MPTPLAMADDTREADGVVAALVRSGMIRRLILLPKITPASAFQPEDHIAQRHVHPVWRRLGPWTMSAVHNGTIFFGGVSLFFGQEWALRKLDPASCGNADIASPQTSAIAGGFGGALYAVNYVALAGWLNTKGNTLWGWYGPSGRSFVRVALPFALVRDVGGFGIYFGAFTLARRSTQSVADSVANGCGLQASTVSSDSGRHADEGVHMALEAASVLASGGLSGLAAFVWRAPFDTLLKRAVGWRPADGPLFSRDGLLRGPRGLKAIWIGATTWGAYELAAQLLWRATGSELAKDLPNIIPPREAPK